MTDDPHTLVDLVRTSNELQAVSLIAELEAHGIPAKAFNVGIMQYHMPMLQGQRIMVRRSDLAQARGVLQDFDLGGDADVNWEEIDTGDTSPLTADEEAGPRFVCARCGYSREGLPAGSSCPECGAPAAQRNELTSGEQNSGGVGQYLVWVVAIVLVLLVLLGWVF